MDNSDYYYYGYENSPKTKKFNTALMIGFILFILLIIGIWGLFRSRNATTQESKTSPPTISSTPTTYSGSSTSRGPGSGSGNKPKDDTSVEGIDPGLL